MVASEEDLGHTNAVPGVVTHDVAAHACLALLLAGPRREERAELHGVREVELAPLLAAALLPRADVHQVFVLLDVHDPQGWHLAGVASRQRLVPQLAPEPAAPEGQGPEGPGGVGVAPARRLPLAGALWAVPLPECRTAQIRVLVREGEKVGRQDRQRVVLCDFLLRQREHSVHARSHKLIRVQLHACHHTCQQERTHLVEVEAALRVRRLRGRVQQHQPREALGVPRGGREEAKVHHNDRLRREEVNRLDQLLRHARVLAAGSPCIIVHKGARQPARAVV
mmetsp:Transcript_41551/g.120298  ORF Transcript_41551/g.120298 Transcript_41551/m.120298 type:complete len:281 (+) Transcript_41551:494-1336(+)